MVFDTFVVFMAGLTVGVLAISILWWIVVASQTAKDARSAAKRKATHIPRRLLNEPGQGRQQHEPSPATHPRQQTTPTRRPRTGNVTWDMDQ